MPMVVQLVRISTCFKVACFWEQKKEIIILVCMFRCVFVWKLYHLASVEWKAFSIIRRRTSAYLVESPVTLAFPGLT